MFLGLSVVAAGCLARVCCPGPAGGWPCLRCATALRAVLWWLLLLEHMGGRQGNAPFRRLLSAYSICPSSSSNLILTGKDIGSHFWPREDTAAGLLGKGTTTLLPAYLSCEGWQCVSVLLSFPGLVNVFLCKAQWINWEGKTQKSSRLSNRLQTGHTG